VFAPASTAPEKLAAMRRLGADVNVSGADLDAAQEAGRAAASATTGAVYIEDGENPDLMAGAATVLGEMLDVLPDLDTVIVPLGGGNLLAGSLLARHAAGSGVDILAVQSQSAPGAVTSWLAGSMTPVPCRTFAGGLATSRPGELALSVMRRLLDSVAVVTDDDLYAAMAVAVATHGLHLEGAAAAPVAAMERCLDDISGERVGLVLTGNWMSAEELRRVNALTAAAEPG
jgi:threonine dehydratase